jgi:hypothetical protein
MNKRNDTVRLGRYAEKMTVNGCPQSLADSIAQQFEPKNPTETLQAFVQAPFEMKFQNSQHFTRCCTLFGDADGVTTTHWHDELKKFYDDYGADIQKRTDKGERKLTVDKRSHACRALVEEQVSIRWNPMEDSEKYFEVHATVSAMLFVAQNWAYSTDSECIPLAGLAAFLTCTRGYAYVFLITVEQLQQAGKDFSSIGSWFDLQTVETLGEKVPQVGLGPGDSVWYPFGYVPVVIGIEKSKDAGDFVAYVVHHVLDEDNQLTPLEVQGEISGHIQKNIAKKLPCLTTEKNEKSLKAHIKKFPVNQ